MTMLDLTRACMSEALIRVRPDRRRSYSSRRSWRLRLKMRMLRDRSSGVIVTPRKSSICSRSSWTRRLMFGWLQGSSIEAMNCVSGAGRSGSVNRIPSYAPSNEMQ